MRRRLLFLALVVVAALAAPACGRGGDRWADHKGDVPFVVGDLDKGLRISGANGKPLLYFFTTTW